MPSVDLNCDVGEGVGADDQMMPHVTSANIACGFHAGDAATMRHTVALALKHGVALGAHPSFADVAGFGRRDIELSADAVRDLVIEQVETLSAVAHAQGARLSHVKAHGALYNMAAKRRDLATAVADAVRSVDATLVLFSLAGSELVAAGRDAGLVVAEEVFADRRYTADAKLVSRSQSGAVITEPSAMVEQALQIVLHNTVQTISGSAVVVRADTICIHGDTPGAGALVRALRHALENAGVAIAAPGATKVRAK